MLQDLDEISVCRNSFPSHCIKTTTEHLRAIVDNVYLYDLEQRAMTKGRVRREQIFKSV